MSPRVTWSAGGEGVVAIVRALHVTVRDSSRAFPPGSTAVGTLHEGNGHAFSLKVAGSRREGEGFTVWGRLVSATVAVRDAFVRSAP